MCIPYLFPLLLFDFVKVWFVCIQWVHAGCDIVKMQLFLLVIPHVNSISSEGVHCGLQLTLFSCDTDFR